MEAKYQIPDPRKGKKEQIAILILIYKTRKGNDYSDRAWDKVHWSRCARSAGLLMEVCGGFNVAQKCLQNLCEKFDSDGFSWTLETVLKHSTEWVNRRRGVIDGKSSYARFLQAVDRRETGQGDLKPITDAQKVLSSVGIPESPGDSPLPEGDIEGRGILHEGDFDEVLPIEEP